MRAWLVLLVLTLLAAGSCARGKPADRALILATLCALCALLSKESGVALLMLWLMWVIFRAGRDPRGWLARQTGWKARANAAQANSFEALPFFIGAVIIAHQLGAPQTRLDILAVLFITLRILYVIMYVAGLPTIRSALWAVALLVNIGILFSGFR